MADSSVVSALLGRRPLSDLNPVPDYFASQRIFGFQKLKEAMLNNIGVDYTKYGNFNDTPTQQQINRNIVGGAPNIGNLQDQQAIMETAQQHGEPGINYPISDLFPRWQQPTKI
jgi:hypothetical protein